MQTWPRVRRALSQPDSFYSTCLENFDELMFSTFSGEDALKEEFTWRFWNPILNAAAELVDKLNRDR